MLPKKYKSGINYEVFLEQADINKSNVTFCYSSRSEGTICREKNKNLFRTI